MIRNSGWISRYSDRLHGRGLILDSGIFSLFHSVQTDCWVKRSGREAGHSPPSSAEDKKGGAIPLLSHIPSWHNVWLIKGRDNFNILPEERCRLYLGGLRFRSRPKYPDWSFRSLSQSLQVNAGTVPLSGRNLLRPNSIQFIHHCAMRHYTGYPRKKVNILRGHSIGNFKQKLYMWMCPIPKGFRDSTVLKLLKTIVSSNGIYCSSDKVGTVYVVQCLLT
jgi:hypothetical protein